MTWDRTRDLPWAKVHDRWFTSPSHVDLEDTTLLVGIRMLLLANRRGRQPDGSGHVVNGAGRPMSVEAIARESHSTPERVRKALVDLCDVETLQDLGGGLYSFPNLRRWQESPDAARKREARARAAGRAGDEEPLDDEDEELGPDIAADSPPDVPPDSPPDIAADSPPDVPRPATADGPASVRTRRSDDQIRSEEGGEPSPGLFGPVEPAQPADTLLVYPCKLSPTSRQTIYPLTRSKVAEWARVFTAINVEREVRRHHQWAKDNPEKRKTFGGWPKSIHMWLASEDKRARARAASREAAPLGPEITARGAAAYRADQQARHQERTRDARPPSPESIRSGLALVRSAMKGPKAPEDSTP